MTAWDIDRWSGRGWDFPVGYSAAWATHMLYPLQRLLPANADSDRRIVIRNYAVWGARPQCAAVIILDRVWL